MPLPIAVEPNAATPVPRERTRRGWHNPKQWHSTLTAANFLLAATIFRALTVQCRRAQQAGSLSNEQWQKLSPTDNVAQQALHPSGREAVVSYIKPAAVSCIKQHRVSTQQQIRLR
ncbi:hypothetical protein ACLKA6_007581 [Drosophila palustris]